MGALSLKPQPLRPHWVPISFDRSVVNRYMGMTRSNSEPWRNEQSCSDFARTEDQRDNDRNERSRARSRRPATSLPEGVTFHAEAMAAAQRAARARAFAALTARSQARPRRA